MNKLIYILFFFVFSFGFAQKDSVKIKQKIKKQLKIKEYNALAPSKAAFYSMIFPGAGQIYNNKYWWQLPLIYGGLGVSIYSYIDSSKKYNRFRTAFKQRKAGLPDEFDGTDGRVFYTEESLESGQEQYKANQNYSILSAVIVYVLQIVEASVSAHLLQFDTTKDLSVTPTAINDFNFEEKPTFGLTLKYNF